jgi:hypothetical protein
MPGRATSPETDSTFVPAERGVPTERNQSAPCSAICADATSVSTLFTIVGRPR